MVQKSPFAMRRELELEPDEAVVCIVKRNRHYVMTLIAWFVALICLIGAAAGVYSVISGDEDIGAGTGIITALFFGALGITITTLLILARIRAGREFIVVTNRRVIAVWSNTGARLYPQIINQDAPDPGRLEILPKANFSLPHESIRGVWLDYFNISQESIAVYVAVADIYTPEGTYRLSGMSRKFGRSEYDLAKAIHECANAEDRFDKEDLRFYRLGAR